MKNGLLICKGNESEKNIGDYIQSLAAELFFDKVDVLVEREELNSFKSTPNKTKVIMNGWFMWNPENWPPSEDILPLLISFHIVPRVIEKMLTPQGIDYLKKFGPVGCRDLGTEKILKSYGIPCYFSGCLTLVLGEKYLSDKKSGEYIFVDPFYECIINSKNKISAKLIISALLTSIVHPIMVKKLYKSIQYDTVLLGIARKLFKIPQQSKSEATQAKREIIKGKRYIKWIEKIERLFQAASFYRTYSGKFDDDILSSAVFIKHTVLQSTFNGESDKFDYAKRLLKRYAEASLVVTSRIHCALPTLALKTPLIFVNSDMLKSGKLSIARTGGRFSGLQELFLSMKYTPSGLIEIDEELKKNIGKITKNTIIENKNNELELKQILINKCKEFVSLSIHC